VRGVAEVTVVTKYFDAAYKSHIENGCFRFGTLRKYRDEENQATEFRQQDHEEGTKQIGLFPVGGKISQMKFPDCSTYNNTTFSGGMPGSTPIIIENSFNDYAFCTSIGNYSTEQHKIMCEGYRFPDGSSYQGDEKLVHYAEISVRAFKRAIGRAVADHEVRKSKLETEQMLIDLPVKYDKKIENRTVPPYYEVPEENTLTAYLDAVFRKRIIYGPEKEYRFVLRPRAPHSIGDELDPRDLGHESFLRSIISIDGKPVMW
jgi:hypothetical protein